jgi:hypothetical protein
MFTWGYRGLSQSMNWESREKPRKTRQCEGMKDSFEHCSYRNMLFSSGLWPCFKQSSLMDRLHGDVYWFQSRMLRFAIFICFNIRGDPLLQVKSAIEFWFQFPTFVSKSNPPPTHLDNESIKCTSRWKPWLDGSENRATSKTNPF